ncbi:MAG: diaminopimelate decarboxylase [Bacteroidales bacterium]
MNFLTDKFRCLPTPFYYYDVDLFKHTIETAKNEADKYNFHIHYALKANANAHLLRILSEAGIGADCVSGAEVQRALDCGFAPQTIAFAGVGKRDDEINLGIDNDIFCFNCESEQEIEIINELAKVKGKKANIALRINPNVDAHTHAHITTGLAENKFGINLWQLESVAKKTAQMSHLNLMSIHFHIGSQIVDLQPFATLCKRVNELQAQLKSWGICVEHVNLGGGLGIDYDHPDTHAIPDFANYFDIIHQNIQLQEGQKLHVELGRSIVGQCASLISKVLYTKELKEKNFVILDAGMTDLIRPALYGAIHKIENLTSSNSNTKHYDIVGPICESSDTFAKDTPLPHTQRGDLIALRSAGAYGEVMASQYNLRSLPKAYYSDQI